MDNVLIDDRRIHVDFSQSVSKIKWKGKGINYILKHKHLILLYHTIKCFWTFISHSSTDLLMTVGVSNFLYK